MTTTITPFLWYDANAGDAVARYLEVFPDAELLHEQPGPDGNLFIAEIRLQGQQLTLMNGGPHHRLSAAFSLMVQVDGQEEVDRISDALIAGGGHQDSCGWLTDAFGLSWQVVPRRMLEMFTSADREAAGRAQQAMLGMKRLNLPELEAAFAG